MLVHGWADEIFFYNYKLHTRCWLLGLKITANYVGNTTLVKKVKEISVV
jgi:hypothetical protein